MVFTSKSTTYFALKNKSCLSSSSTARSTVLSVSFTCTDSPKHVVTLLKSFSTTRIFAEADRNCCPWYVVRSHMGEIGANASHAPKLRLPNCTLMTPNIQKSIYHRKSPTRAEQSAYLQCQWECLIRQVSTTIPSVFCYSVEAISTTSW